MTPVDHGSCDIFLPSRCVCGVSVLIWLLRNSCRWSLGRVAVAVCICDVQLASAVYGVGCSDCGLSSVRSALLLACGVERFALHTAVDQQKTSAVHHLRTLPV